MLMNCDQCGIEFRRRDNRRSKHSKYFCSGSCRATFVNLNYKKQPVQGKCFNCAEPVSSSRKFCSDCRDNTREALRDINTLENYKTLTRDCYSYGNKIRNHARTTVRQLKVPQRCCVCGYDKVIQICHIIGVKDWPPETPISTVNDPINLTLLCPNHHAEFDRGILPMNYIRFIG